MTAARRDLAQLAAEYIARRRAERISESRVRVDRSALALLVEEMRRLTSGPEASAVAVTKGHLLLALSRLRDRNLSPGSLNHYIASFRGFFGDLYGRGLLLTNPAEKLHHLPHDALPRQVPTRQEMRRLLEAADLTTPLGRRDRALFELLYGSGLRKSELLKLDVADVDLAERTVFIRSGKGKKDRLVPITEEAARWMATYLSERPKRRSPRFFLGSRLGRPLHVPYLNIRLRELARKASIDRPLTIHAVRHACALHLLEGGADVVSIKNLLGHARLDTTAVYLRLSTEHLKRLLLTHHPRG